MDCINWLAQHRFTEALRYEYAWDFIFDGGTGVSAECLWRLIENGRIRFTSRDDGHKFGLPSPVDVVLELNQRLAGVICTSVVLRDGTLDLEIHFDTGHVLQIIPDSSGYESWNARNPPHEFIAVGGGNLAVIGRSNG